MEIIVREATEEDFGAMNEIYRETGLLHVEGVPDVFRMPEGDILPREYMLQMVSGDEHLLLVAELDGEIVGLAQGHLRVSPDYPVLVPRKYAHLEDIGVKQQFRRRGIGRALLERFHQWAAEKGASSVELNVWAFNESAVEAYKALGYEFASHKMWKKLSSENADSE